MLPINANVIHVLKKEKKKKKYWGGGMDTLYNRESERVRKIILFNIIDSGRLNFDLISLYIRAWF